MKNWVRECISIGWRQEVILQWRRWFWWSETSLREVKRALGSWFWALVAGSWKTRYSGKREFGVMVKWSRGVISGAVEELIGELLQGLTDWLNGWLIGELLPGLTDWLIEWLSDWLIDYTSIYNWPVKGGFTTVQDFLISCVMTR